MSAARFARHALVWLGAFAFWFVATRDNQPSLPVAVAATAILTATAAVAVYCDWYLLRPRFTVAGRWRAYSAALAATVAALTFPTVFAIQTVYDAAGVPVERRFGFWTNVGYEAAWYALHLVVAAAIRALTRERPSDSRKHHQ
jgi:hypothetical protein